MKNKKEHNSYQLTKINKSLKKVKDPEIRERLLLVKDYYELGSTRKAGKRHQCSHGKVQYWKERYEKRGQRGLETEPKSGRPPKLSKEQETSIKKEVLEKTEQEGGWETRQIRDYIKKKAGVAYSERHTIRIAQKWGLSQKKPRPQYGYAKEKEKEDFLKEEHSILRES